MKKYVASGQTPPWSSWGATQKSRTYDAVKAAGDEGISREDICKQTALPKQRVWFYLSELRRAGLIKRLGDAVDPASLSPEDALLFAMSALENALVARCTKQGTTPELERAFLRYSKVKALALGAKTGGEESAALKRCMLDLVQMVF